MAEIEEIPIEAEDPPENTQDIHEDWIFSLLPRKEGGQLARRINRSRHRNQNQRQNKSQSSMRNIRSPRKKRLHHPADEPGQNNQWSWIAMLLPVKCLEFFNSSGTSGRVRGDHTMPAGSRIYPKVNGEETNHEQGSCRTIGCDQTTECAEAS